MGSLPVACGRSSSPTRDWTPGLLHWARRVLAIGQSGKSCTSIFLNHLKKKEKTQCCWIECINRFKLCKYSWWKSENLKKINKTKNTTQRVPKYPLSHTAFLLTSHITVVHLLQRMDQYWQIMMNLGPQCVLGFTVWVIQLGSNEGTMSRIHHYSII